MLEFPNINRRGDLYSMDSTGSDRATSVSRMPVIVSPPDVRDLQEMPDRFGGPEPKLIHAQPETEDNEDIEENDAIADVVSHNMPHAGRSKKGASLFMSSPGALSSETRDASINQGKYDMAGVLQMQLRQDAPCLVCDISSGIVMVTNIECERLFESSGANCLVRSDIYSFISQDYSDAFSTALAYLMVSEKVRMDSQEVRITTLTGRTKHVRVDGMQLIGMWWQFDFQWLREMDES